MEEYLEKLVVQKQELLRSNATLMALIAHITRDFDRPYRVATVQLEVAPKIALQMEDDGYTLVITDA